jgi:hypothetical protein
MDVGDVMRRLYADLADCYDQRGQAQFRDRFLVLAADAALTAGRGDESERLRQRLLQSNPHHLLKPYSTFAQAMQAADVQFYVRDLRANYPREVAENLLHSLKPPLPQAVTRVTPMPETVDGEAGSRTEFADDGDFLRLTEAKSPPAFVPVADAPSRTLRLPEPSGVYPISEDEWPVPTRARANRPRAAPGPTRPIPDKPVKQPRTPPQPVTYTAEPASPDREGAWLGSLLFGVVFVAGVACAAHVLVRPLLVAR